MQFSAGDIDRWEYGRRRNVILRNGPEAVHGRRSSVGGVVAAAGGVDEGGDVGLGGGVGGGKGGVMGDGGGIGGNDNVVGDDDDDELSFGEIGEFSEGEIGGAKKHGADQGGGKGAEGRRSPRYGNEWPIFDDDDDDDDDDDVGVGVDIGEYGEEFGGVDDGDQGQKTCYGAQGGQGEVQGEGNGGEIGDGMELGRSMLGKMGWKAGEVQTTNPF